ncbi:sensor histidine kinase [Salimicrobium halophilum]|uniref:Two-component system, sensor histidine kinase YesM n=1 Tax=Salimicrobium halophilum TaxID=86666 RepID=A0A1G8T6X4_9BACI|nr:sensor histidine kinase [Salimicrobium halophilum]SDJ37306.1 two-component system, sensor histidine kinase YesM [Salimicrobium halophilum]
MLNLFKRAASLSLRYRITIAVVVCVFLPWVMTYIVSNYMTKDILEQRAVRQSEDSLRVVEMSINKSFSDLMYLSNFIQFDTEFNKLIGSYQKIDQSLEDAEQKMAMQKLEISGYLEGITNTINLAYITILFDKDMYYTNYSTNEYNPSEIFEEEWFDKLQSLNYYETYWMGAQPNYIQSESSYSPYLITMGRTIQESNNDQVYVMLSAHENDISEVLSNYTNESMQEFYLLNEKGTILSSVNKQEIGRELPYDLSMENEYQVVDYHEKEHLLVTQSVSHTNWSLVSLVPYKQTIGNINMITRTTIIIQGAFLLLFLIALIILVRETTKPLERIGEVTKEVEQGNIIVRTNIEGSNDISKLGQSFDEMLNRVEKMIDQIKHKEEAKRTAELEMLQAQINPHFLFNVLNAIRLNVSMKGDVESSKLLRSLSSLLRMTINRNNAFIPLKEEIEIIKHYVDLMNFRHDQNIKLVMDLDEMTCNEEVPRFFLQPIIENAIIHGFDSKEGSVKIKTCDVEDHLLISISDDGKGIDSQKLASIKKTIFSEEIQSNKSSENSFNGIGIKNVYQRMRIVYGEAFRMNLTSTLGKGTDYTFYIPKEK